MGAWPLPYSASPFFKAAGVQLSGLGLTSACSASASSAHTGSSAASQPQGSSLVCREAFGHVRGLGKVRSSGSTNQKDQ